MSVVKVACGQFTVSSNIPHNLSIIKKLLNKAISQNVKILFLPEASDYLARNANHSFRLSQTTEKLLLDPLCAEIKALNQSKHDISVSIGIHAPDKSGKTINRLLWINNEGEIQYIYDKLHLFDVNIKNGPILKESNSVIKGQKILDPFKYSDSKFNIGYLICYDIRFPEFALKLFKLGANILTYPSAFTVKTGESHWQTLGRTRAMDNQSYVIMAAQCGEHSLVDEQEESEEITKRLSYGNSLIIDPWGDILAQGKKYNEELVKDEEGDYYELIVADLDYDKIENVRMNMPLLAHRRDDIFGE